MKKYLKFTTTDEGDVYVDILSVSYVYQIDDGEDTSTRMVTVAGKYMTLTHAADTTGTAMARWWNDNVKAAINNPYIEVLYTATTPPVAITTIDLNPS